MMESSKKQEERARAFKILSDPQVLVWNKRRSKTCTPYRISSEALLQCRFAPKPPGTRAESLKDEKASLTLSKE